MKQVTRGCVTSNSGAADPVAVADADLVVGHPLDGEVLAELAGDEVVAAEHLRPVLVGRPVVDVDGAMLAAVADQVGLAVAVDVQAAHAPPARHRRLEDRRPHRAAPPPNSRGSPTLTEISCISQPSNLVMPVRYRTISSNHRIELRWYQELCWRRGTQPPLVGGATRARPGQYRVAGDGVWHDGLADRSGHEQWLRANGLAGAVSPAARHALVQARDAIRASLERPGPAARTVTRQHPRSRSHSRAGRRDRYARAAGDRARVARAVARRTQPPRVARRASRTRPPVRQSRLRALVPRHDPLGDSPLVLDDGLRKPSEGPTPLPAATSRLTARASRPLL